MQTIGYAGKQHIVYEYPEEAIQAGIEFKEYWEAKEGDYVISENSFVVPLLKKHEVVATKRRVGKKYYPRANPYTTYIYTFPQCKFTVRPSKDITQPRKRFFYQRKFGIIQDIYQQSGKTLTPRKMYFALLLANGFPPDVAIGIAHTNLRKSVLRSKLFEYMTCPQVIYYFTFVAMNMGSLKEELEKRGINNQTMADRIMQLMDNEEAPAVIRKFALETAIKALDNNVQQTINPSYLPQGIDVIAIRERLQLKATELQK